jgi:hypothetical protein
MLVKSSVGAGIGREWPAVAMDDGHKPARGNYFLTQLAWHHQLFFSLYDCIFLVDFSLSTVLYRMTTVLLTLSNHPMFLAFTVT